MADGNSPEASGAEEKEIPAYGPASTTPGFAFSVVLEVLWVTKPVPDASGGINSQVRPRFRRGDICTEMLRSMVRFHLAPPAQAMFPQVKAGFGMTAHDRWSPQKTAPCQSIWHVRGTFLTAGNGQDPRPAGRCPPDRHRRD